MFTATTKPGRPAALFRYSSGSQLALVNSTLAYAVYARDGHGCALAGCGNLISGAPITWAVTAGGGTITPTQDTTAITSLNPVIPLSRAVHTLGPDEGPATASATSPAGPTVTFTTSAVTALVQVLGVNSGYWIAPASVLVPSGRTVGWIWNTSGDAGDVHNITFEDDPTQPTSSPTLSNSGVFTRTFGGVPRTIRYRCTLHSSSFTQGEVGTVTVQ